MVKRFHGSRRFIFTGSWSATHVLLSFVFFYEKQAIRRRQFAAIDCDVFMCGSYRIAGSELPRGLMCRCFPNKVVTRHSADKPWVTDGFRALVLYHWRYNPICIGWTPLYCEQWTLSPVPSHILYTKKHPSLVNIAIFPKMFISTFCLPN